MHRSRGRGGRSGRGGYDWRKHTRPSGDPVVQNEVRETIQNFINCPHKSMKREIRCGGEEKNTYKQYCKQMGVGWVRGSMKGTFQLMRFTSADPSLTLWKKVWCFYFSQCCDVDLISEAENNMVEVTKEEAKPSAWDIDDVKPSASAAAGIYDDTDEDEAAAILRLRENNDANADDDDMGGESFSDSKKKFVLDSTANSFDGKRMWIKVRDLLQDIKHDNNQLWEECCSLGVNNCSERKLEAHIEQVNKFFELQGRGPNQKMRGKKLRVEVGHDESVHFLEAGDNFVVEYAKPVLFGDTAALKNLIQLVDKANHSLGADDALKGGEENLPSNIFNDNWRRIDLRKRLDQDSVDPIYCERRDNLRKRLPAFEVGRQFCNMVFSNDVVVLCGATGCGKTTQLPQILMEEAVKLMHEQPSGLVESKRQFGTGRIICTQPRRISATSVAERVCYERNEKMGDRVGYQIRFEQKATDTTELLYCTTGILLRIMVGNPKLEGISCVIIDEVHERGVHTDFVLLILKDLVLERKGTNEPLKIVLMSATIDASNFLKYFDPNSKIKFNNMSMCEGTGSEGGSNGRNPIVSAYSVSFLQVPGKTNYPITEYFIEDVCQEIPSLVVSGPPPARGGRSTGVGQDMRNSWATPEAVKAKYHELGLKRKSGDNRMWKNLSNMLQRPFELDVDLICRVVEHIEYAESMSTEKYEGALGSILIFAPGWKEITDVIKGLENTLKDCRKRHSWARTRSWNILPLHSMIPQKEQMRIFDSEDPNSGRRKIIVSTSLAETSITVEDVVYVIDPGLLKGTTYSAHTNIASLETMQISRSNVQQRRGRAGRCRPGVFYKLYSQYEFLHEMTDHELPEMLRTPVEELVLQTKTLRLPGDLRAQQVLTKAVDPPEPLAVVNAVQLLTELGAFGTDEKLTPLGWRLSQLPVHPCLGKMMLLGSLFDRYSSRQSNLLTPIQSICSTLSFKTPFVLPFGKEKEADAARKNYGQGLFSDHLLFAKVSDDYNRRSKYGSEFFQWLDRNFLSKKALEMTAKIQQDLERHLNDHHMNNSGDNFDSRRSSYEKAVSRPLLSAILAASLSISFTSPGSQKLCSLQGGSACSVHPSSLLSMIETSGNERMLWRKYKHLLRGPSNDKIVENFVLGSPDKVFIIGWFERLKTTEVYLRDCSLFSDPLPLLLLLPGVKQRGNSGNDQSPGVQKKSKYAEDPCLFEVVGGQSSQGGDGHKQAGNDSRHPMLLLKVQDETTAQLLNSLRAKLAVFFDCLLSKETHGNIGSTTSEVFHGLESLIEKSYSLYMTDSSHHLGGVDPDILDVRHLHNSAHCELLDPNLEEGGDTGMELDDDVDEYEQDRYGSGWSTNDNWTSSNSDRYGSNSDRYNWRGGRGRAKRGRGGGRGRGSYRGRGSR